MAASPPRMVLVIDEHVPQSLAAFLQDRGHDVRRVVGSGLEGEKDPLIAKAANDLGAIVVTFNHRHFAILISRATHSGRNRYPRAGRLSLRCEAAVAVRRVPEFIEEIELEHAKAQTRTDKRVIISLSDKWFSIER